MKVTPVFGTVGMHMPPSIGVRCRLIPLIFSVVTHSVDKSFDRFPTAGSRTEVLKSAVAFQAAF